MLTKSSLSKLEGVHPHLVAVIKAAAEGPVAFQVTEGVRSLNRQRALVKQGASRTLRSRHIPAPNGLAHAVDLVAVISGRISWEVPLYHRLADQVKAAAKKLGIQVEWGGDWKGFFDGPHFQLPWEAYPGTASAKDIAPPAPLARELSTMVPGSTGSDVADLQAALIALGHDITIDASFGPKTRKAVLIATERLIGKATDIVTLSVFGTIKKAAKNA